MEHQNFFLTGLLKNYRDGYGIYASNGVLFNHESPRRGETLLPEKSLEKLLDIN